MQTMALSNIDYGTLDYCPVCYMRIYKKKAAY